MENLETLRAAYQAALVARSDAEQDVRFVKAEWEASNYGEAECVRFAANREWSRPRHAQVTTARGAYEAAAEPREQSLECACICDVGERFFRARYHFSRSLQRHRVGLWLVVCLTIYGVIVIVFRVAFAPKSCSI
jgi:hypothetical protein